MSDTLNEVREKCILRANALLDNEIAPTAATAEAIKALVETAISVDMLNLRCQEKIRFYAAGHLGSASQLQAKGS